MLGASYRIRPRVHIVYSMQHPETLTHHFLRRGFWLYLFSFLIAPTGYIIKMVLSHDLTLSEYGTIYAVISLVTILAAYNDLGCTESLKFFLPKYIAKNDKKSITQLLLYSLIIQMLSSALLGCALWYGSEYLATHYFQDPIAAQVLQIFIVFFFGVNLFQVTNTCFAAIQDTKLQK